MADSLQSGKLAVILHADVAGSTALVQQDEQVAHQRIQDTFRRFGDTINRYHGHVRELRGDALLAEFERASDAVTAALAFQADHIDYLSSLNDTVQPVVRVGIAMGEVIIADATITGAGVVLAQRLEQLSEPGGVVIQGAAYETIPGRFPFEYANLGEREVKGFEGPVRVYSASLKRDSAIPQPSPVVRGTRNTMIAVACVAIIITGIALMWFKPWEAREEPASVERMAFPLPDKPSIAVLPFTNMSDDSQQEYFADGMTDDLITDLSKLSGLFVIARNSVFTYKGTPVKVRQVAEELGVRYVLEGSVRRADDKIRINAQLIDATTGGHLWAERYDGKLADVFALQDKVTGEIVRALSVTLNAGEQAMAGQTETSVPEAYDAVLTGWRHLRLRTVEDYRTALIWLEKAVTLDPDYGRAWALMASLYYEAWERKWAGQLGVSAEKIPELLDKALQRPTPLAYRVKAKRLMSHKRFDEAEIWLDKASTLDPNDPDTFVLRSQLVAVRGDTDTAIALIKTAMRLDPHYPAFNLSVLGGHYLQAGDVAKAIEFLERAQKRNPGDWFDLVLLTVAYAEGGRLEDAERAAKTLVERRRELGFLVTLAASFDVWWTFKGTYRERIHQALLKAGLPDMPRPDDLNLAPKHLISGAELREAWKSGYRHKGQGRGGVWMRDVYPDGTGVHYWKGRQTSTTKARIEGDTEYNERSDGRKSRCTFYRNPEGTKENMNEFISVCAHGIWPYAVFPLPEETR